MAMTFDDLRSICESVEKTGKNYCVMETSVYTDKDASGGHGGSHPHMVHEFLRSCLEGRKSWINDINGANIVAAGIAAHVSAMKNGAIIELPDFTVWKT
jgi:hypothetical protein